jgi:dienelactone hydrolase
MAVTKQITLTGGLAAMVHFPSWRSKDANGLRAVIACHGHGGSDVQESQGGPFVGHPEYWADRGYVVGMVSTGDTWLNSVAMSDITTLYDYLMTLGPVSTKVGLLAWSMGGGHALRWLIENPTKVAAGYLCSPLTDLNWAHAANTTYATEIDAAYGGNFAANGAPRAPINNPASFRGGPKLLIAHAQNDSTLPRSQTDTFVSAVNDQSVTMRQPDVLVGDHQGGLTQVPPRETWEWIRTKWAG